MLADRLLNTVIVQCCGGVRVSLFVQTRACGTCMSDRALLTFAQCGLRLGKLLAGFYFGNVIGDAFSK